MTIKLEFSEKPYEYKDGKLLFWATGITKNYATLPQLQSIFEKAKGTKVLYRHRSNVSGSGEVHGYVKNAIFNEKDSTVDMQLELHEVTDEDKRVLREVVGSIVLAQEHGQKPYGVSVHFQTVHESSDKEQTPLKFHLEEISVTPIPACKECEIKLEEKMEDNPMPEGDNIFAKTVLENTDLLKKEILKKEVAFEELSKQFSDVQSANESLIEKHDKLFEEKKELEVKVKELEGKLDTDKKELLEKIEFLEQRKPLLDEIKQYEKSEFILKLLETQPREDLQKYLDEKKNAPQAHQETPVASDPNAASLASQSMEQAQKESGDIKDLKFEDEDEIEEIRQKILAGKHYNAILNKEVK